MPDPRPDGYVPEEARQAPSESIDPAVEKEANDPSLYYEFDEASTILPYGSLERQRMVEAISESLRQIFPRTFNIVVRGPESEDIFDLAHSKKVRANHLFVLGSLIKRLGVDLQQAHEELIRLLNGKKVLVLGDDTGSMSEVLNGYGAQAFGVEYSADEILKAHSGVYSEDQRPQLQVIQGNIHDISREQSQLYQDLMEIGPFDVITSDGVFNLGSGLENGLIRAEKQEGGTGYSEVSSLWENLYALSTEQQQAVDSRDRYRLNRAQQQVLDLHAGLNSLLSSGGFQAHLDVDMRAMFPPTHLYGPRANVAVMPKFEDVKESFIRLRRENPNRRGYD